MHLPSRSKFSRLMGFVFAACFIVACGEQMPSGGDSQTITKRAISDRVIERVYSNQLARLALGSGDNWQANTESLKASRDKQFRLLIEVRHLPGYSRLLESSLRADGYTVKHSNPAYERITLWVEDVTKLRGLAQYEQIFHIATTQNNPQRPVTIQPYEKVLDAQ